LIEATSGKQSEFALAMIAQFNEYRYRKSSTLPEDFTANEHCTMRLMALLRAIPPKSAGFLGSRDYADKKSEGGYIMLNQFRQRRQTTG
jgi:cysteine synthase B